MLITIVKFFLNITFLSKTGLNKSDSSKKSDVNGSPSQQQSSQNTFQYRAESSGSPTGQQSSSDFSQQISAQELLSNSSHQETSQGSPPAITLVAQMIKEAKRPQAAFGLSVTSIAPETPTVTLSLPSESTTSTSPTPAAATTSSSSESASSPPTSEDETEIKVLMDYDNTNSPKETRSVLTVLQGVNPTPEENTSDNVTTTIVATDTITTAASSNIDGHVLKKVCIMQ